LGPRKGGPKAVTPGGPKKQKPSPQGLLPPPKRGPEPPGNPVEGPKTPNPQGAQENFPKSIFFPQKFTGGRGGSPPRFWNLGFLFGAFFFSLGPHRPGEFFFFFFPNKKSPPGAGARASPGGETWTRGAGGQKRGPDFLLWKRKKPGNIFFFSFSAGKKKG